MNKIECSFCCGDEWQEEETDHDLSLATYQYPDGEVEESLICRRCIAHIQAEEEIFLVRW